ncbi:MAG: DUF1523 family protein [Paracoccaceae bacterium]
MRYAKWVFYALLLLAVAGFLHYTLPQHDVVRILGTEIKRQSVEVENEKGETVTRNEDVRYIQTVTPDGEPYVYRNEDTGWGWPPYFKFDSANLATRAETNVSSEENPKWFVITHYGWRWSMFSWFPNAISMERAEGPDQTIIPWFNIATILALIALALVLRHRLSPAFARLTRPRDGAETG